MAPEVPRPIRARGWPRARTAALAIAAAALVTMRRGAQAGLPDLDAVWQFASQRGLI